MNAMIIMRSIGRPRPRYPTMGETLLGKIEIKMKHAQIVNQNNNSRFVKFARL